MGVFPSLILKPTSQIPTAGLVAEYLGNNNFLDTSGNGYDGVNTNVTFGTDRKSQANSAFVFNSSAFVDIDTALAGLTTPTSGAWSYWVKPTTSPTITQEFLLSFSNKTINPNHSLGNSMISGILRAQYVNPSASVDWRVDTDANPFTAGVWTHVLNNFNNIENKLYIDGVFVAQTFGISIDKTSWINDMTSPDSGRIGNRRLFSGEQSHYAGSIDDIRLYNRELTTDEITALFNE